MVAIIKYVTFQTQALACREVEHQQIIRRSLAQISRVEINVFLTKQCLLLHDSYKLPLKVNTSLAAVRTRMIDPIKVLHLIIIFILTKIAVDI